MFDIVTMPSRGDKLALLTVGSTEFRPLVDAALSQPVLDALSDRGCTRFIVQYGKQERPSVVGERANSATGSAPSSQLQVELHAFIGDIEEKMVEAHLVLCHAGARSWTSIDSSSSSTRLTRSLASLSFLSPCVVLYARPGAGSILAALRGPALAPLTASDGNEKERKQRSHLVIVPNDTLMDAHQSELAEEMHRHGWAVVATPRWIYLAACPHAWLRFWRPC